MNVAHKQFETGMQNFPVAAFTLIELLIAVAISAIVLATISTLFFGALHLREKAAEAAEQTLPVDRAVAIMKRDLLAIVPPSGGLAGSTGTDATTTGTTQPALLEIFSASGDVSADAPWGDIQKIDYMLLPPTNRTGSAGLDLVRGVTRNLLATTPTPPEPHTLLSDVQTLRFNFYDGTNWNDTWSTTLSNIPVAIRVSIDFATSKTDTQFKPPVQFTVPVVSWATTNSVTNQSTSNN
jgi:type II secretion system protein J